MKLFGKKRYKVDGFLVRVAIEDAAQIALRRELERQINAQLPAGHEACFNNVIVDVTIDKHKIRVEGVPVEWVNDVV